MFQAIASIFAKVLDIDILQCAERLNEQIKTNNEACSSENGEHSEEKGVDTTEVHVGTKAGLSFPRNLISCENFFFIIVSMLL